MQAENVKFSALKSAFEASDLPFALLNSELRLMYTNDALLKRIPAIHDPIVFFELFKKLSKTMVLGYLKTERHYEFTCDLPDQKGAKISLNSVFSDEGEFLGAAAVISPVAQSEGVFPAGSDCDYPRAVNREFRTRLNTMFTALIAISGAKDFNPPDNVCEYLNEIHQKCYHLLRVSDNLERILRLSSQDEMANFKTVNFADYVTDRVNAIIRMDNKNQIPIKLDCKCSALPVRINLSKIEFAIANIILNSIKYNREGNEIEITLNRVGDNAVLSISDKGAGIPKDILKKVGTPYFSYSHGNKFDEGFGIGLYIAKKYIAAHSGVFSIQSEEGVGTCVCISIPLYKEKNDGVVTDITFEKPDDFNPNNRFSDIKIQLSEVFYYPEI